MAEEQQLELKPQGGKKKLLIIIAAVVLLLLIGGGAGAWFMLSKGGDKGSGGEHAKTEEEKAAEAAAKMAMYVVLPRPFVFNVEAKPRYRLVQIKVALMVRGPKNEALARLHTPLVEGALLKVLTMASAQQLSTVEGRTKLKADALAAVKQALRSVTEENVVDRVLFTDFVMQ